jgi:Ran GTPase-activating protein (RanGAP) involved in mRNA processing and transport
MFDSNPLYTSGPSQWEAMVINPGYLMRTKQATANHINGYDITKIIQETSLYDGIKLRGQDAMFQSDDDSPFLEGSNSAEMSIRNSQDLLLYEQVREGSLPEFILKPKLRDDKTIEVDLSNMGIGDKQGSVLAKSLQKLDDLSILNLHNNRLTNISFVDLFRFLPSKALKTLNLSTNKFDGTGVGNLARFLNKENIVEILNLSNCNLQCSDIIQLDTALTRCGVQRLKKIILTSNNIKHEGSQVLAHLLSKTDCVLDTIDLGWNTIGSLGAVGIANALKTNSSLLYLDLAANAVDDIAAQRIGAAIATNSKIKEVYLSQNMINDAACFVFSKSLNDHPSLMKLDLSTNPVGEAGARALFRLILKGLRTFVMMRSCSYKHDDSIFDFENPSFLSPYTLDLSEPYKAAVLFELINLATLYPEKCKFDNVLYRENSKSKDSSIALAVTDGVLCLKGTSQKWIPPTVGIMTVSFSYFFAVPTLAEATPEKSIKIFEMIVTLARSEVDRKQWVDMMTKDINTTTNQLQGTIDRFKASGIIGAGGLRVIDVIANIWSRILDAENCFDFLNKNLDKTSLRQLKHIVSFDNFKFNWKNPTGHYRIELHNPSSRITLLKLLAINQEESNYSKNISKRNDTSQKGNWCNFRNELFNTRDNEVSIDAAFIADLPKKGVLEFDYVSTLRPIPTSDVQSSPDSSDAEDDEDGAGAMMSSLLENANCEEKLISATSQLATKPIDEDEFYNFLIKLNLSRRHRMSEIDASYSLLDLQLAAAKYYFSISNVNHILDCYPDSTHTQAKVVITLYSRIWDLHNFDIIMRNLHSDTRNEIILRLGWLNIGNPLKLAGEYTIPLTFLDGRIFLLTMLEIDQLFGDQIRDTPKSEIPLISLYGGLNRLKTESKPEKISIIFAELGPKVKPPNWNIRVEKLNRFLICSYPMHKDVFLCIRQYKEMAKSGTLGNGPIDLQYMQHIKQISRDRIASRNVSLLKSRERSRGSTSNSTNEGLVGTIPEDNIII